MKLPAKVVRSANGAPQFEIKYKEHPYRVKLFKFQENYPDDSVIECVMTHQANGDLFFRQDLKALVNEFYNVGDEYEFSVKHDFSHNGYYELLDERGIPFRLPVPKGMRLLTGSSVKCKLTGVEASGGQLKLVDTTALFEGSGAATFSSTAKPTTRLELDAKSIADRVFADLYPEEDPVWDPDRIFELLFKNDDYYEQAVNSGLLEYINAWRRDEEIEWEEVQRRLFEIREAIMYVLEGSTILLGVDPLRRKSLQQRLTVLAHNVSGYYRAAKQLSEQTHTDKVNRVLGCLRTSGYIYEAEQQLDMMMRIFSLSSNVMVENMAQIFDIIHARNEDFWGDEPFRTAFIRLLQMYVEQVRRGMENGSAADHDATIRSLIEALAIQLLIADRERDAEVFDYNLNLASLYRYASMLRTSVPDNALRNAFLALMDVTRRPSGLYRWSESGAHDLIASKLTAMPVGLEETFEKTYESRPVMLRVTTDGITVSRTDVAADTLKPLDLNGVGVWPRLSILTPQKIATVSNTADLRRARDMWNAIEKSLFSQEEDVRRPLTRRLAQPGKDDVCTVRVLRQIDDVTFAVEVTDEFFEGRGQITVDEMVNYKVPNLRYEHFCGKTGHPLLFQAKVKKVDDTIHFTILEALLNYSHDNIGNDNPMRCVIKSSNQYGKVGVSEWGDAVKFKPVGEFANIKVGDVVIGNFWTRPTNAKEKNYIEGVVTEVLDDPDPFVTSDAFADLLYDYCNGEEYIDPNAAVAINNESADGTDMLSDQRLNELMVLVERKAAGESDYMKAFNHIGFARLLAKMARNDRRREFYEAWMRLISILHHFAVNGAIDTSSLADFEENDRSQFDSNSELYRRYLQLKVVSYKGQPHMRDVLWGYMAHEDEEIRNLASNVMAYNLIAENSSASVLGEIDDRINNILHVHARKSTLHSFGSENKTTEFKSSLLFPPNNHMRANPEQQTVEIMKELCALLNADGGTLYIGVNDFGMGVGIENDLSYRDKMLDGSEDKYDLYFRRAVCRILGKDADAYVDSSFQEYGGKKIYVVKVKPYYTEPLKVEGVIYERHGSSKLPFYDPEDIRRFTERRAEERERQRLTLSSRQKAEEAKQRAPKEELADKPLVTPAPAEPEAPKGKPARKAQPEAAKQTDTKGAKDAKEANPEKIRTRASRGVCPASYDPAHDPATSRYLEIRKDEFQMVPDFYGYSDDDADLMLVLPLKDEDVRSWLVLGYEDGTVCRVPMRLFFDKQDYTPGKRYTGSPLIFADVMTDDDALIQLSRNVSGNWNARADRTADLPECSSMRSPGERVFNTVKEEYKFNVLSGAAVLNYSDLLGRTNKDAGKNFTAQRHDRLYQQLHKDGFMD